MNTESIVFLSVVFFLGLTLGWFFRGPFTIWRTLLAVIALGVFSPFLEIMIAIDSRYLTAPFLLGFLVHTWKPIYAKFKG